MHLGGLTGREATARTWKGINEHAIMTRAAAIAFYAIAALIPFMGLLIALTAHWLPWIEQKLGATSTDPSTEPLAYLLPEDAVSFIAHELKRLRERPPSGLISFSVAALLWLSTSVFVEIIDAMNAILGVEETRPFWKRRLTAIVMTMSQAMILIGTVVTIIAWPQILKLMGLSQPASIVATAVHGVSVFIMVLLSFALCSTWDRTLTRTGCGSPRAACSAPPFCWVSACCFGSTFRTGGTTARPTAPWPGSSG